MPTIRDLLELHSTPTPDDMLPIDTPTGTRKISSALLRGLQGPQGEAGPPGPQGLQGEPAPPLEFVTNALSAAVSLTTSNVWYNGPSISLTAGTWLVVAHLTHWRTATTAGIVYARLTDDATTWASTQGYHASLAGIGVPLGLAALITLTEPTTVKLQAATSAGASTSQMIPALTTLPVGNNATRISAVKIG